MSLATLFGKLQEHEMELSRLEEVEVFDKGKGKSIALKATSEKKEENSETDSSNDEEITLLAKKFRKFLRRNQKKKNFKPAKKSDSNNKLTCFECGKSGHFKSDCPDLKKKQDKKFKKKPRKAYIAWEDNDSTASSSSSEQEEQANLCLMTKGDTEVLELSDSNSSTNKFSSTSHTSYNTLYNAFQELLKDSEITEWENNELKTQIIGLTKENKELKSEIEKLNLQIDFMDSLEINSSECLNCHKIEKKINRNKTNVRNIRTPRKKKLSKEDNILDSLLKAQRNCSNRQGLGYKGKTKGSNKTREKQRTKIEFVRARKLPTCNYCLKIGHISTACFIKLYGLKNGKYKWVEKNSHRTDLHGPSVTCLPT